MTSEYLNFFEETAEVFISPEKILNSVKEKKETKKGIYFLIFYSAFSGLILGLIFAGLFNNPIIALLFVILVVVVALLKVFIWALITHIVAKIVFNGDGELGSLFGLMGYSAAPYILLIVAITAMAFGKAIFASLLMFAIAVIWMIVIGIIATESEHKIGYGKSFLSCIGIPAIVVILVFFIMGVL